MSYAKIFATVARATFLAASAIICCCGQPCFAAENTETDDLFADEPAQLVQPQAPSAADATAHVDISSSRVSSGIDSASIDSPRLDISGTAETTAIGGETNSGRMEQAEKGPQPVPVAEPTSLGLLAVGLFFLFFLARNRRAPGRG